MATISQQNKHRPEQPLNKMDKIKSIQQLFGGADTKKKSRKQRPKRITPARNEILIQKDNLRETPVNY